jgi:cytochrome c oxidase cbb3-type subunit III
MKRHLFLFAVLFAGALFNTEPTTSQEKDAKPDPLTQGKRLFVGHCALCHGIEGTGGRGPSLNQPKLRNVTTGLSLSQIIREGIRETEMPGFWQLSDREITLVADYVRSLGSTSPANLRGDAARGKVIFERGGCASCHIVQGRGGNLGPDLTTVGARRSPAYLRESMTDPGRTVPEGFLIVAVTTSDGRRIRGLRANEDSFTIQLRDTENRFHSFRKSEIKELRKEFGASTMPSYRDSLSAGELDDLIAYLAGLRGGK